MMAVILYLYLSNRTHSNARTHRENQGLRFPVSALYK
jgi:hypothetical protein